MFSFQIKDNKDKFSKKYLSSLKLTFFLSAIFISGCSTMEGTYNSQKISITANSNATKIKSFDNSSFREIFDKEQSGVYANPYGEDGIVTIQFLFDSNAKSSIQSDLFEIGINPDIFQYKDQTKELPDGALIGDTNLSFYSPSEYSSIDLVNLIVLEGNDIRSGLIPKKYYNSYPDFKDYDEYFIAMHEIAHGFKYQKFNVYSSFKSVFSGHKIKIRNENGSDFSALVKTIQLMHKEGKSLDEINSFIDLGMQNRISNGYDENEVQVHITSPVFNIVSSIYRSNPSYIYKMSDKDVINASNIVSSIVVNHDYSEDLIYAFNTHESVLKDSMIGYGHLLNVGDDIEKKATLAFENYIKSRNGIYLDQHLSQKILHKLEFADFPGVVKESVSALKDNKILTP